MADPITWNVVGTYLGSKLLDQEVDGCFDQIKDQLFEQVASEVGLFYKSFFSLSLSLF